MKKKTITAAAVLLAAVIIAAGFFLIKNTGEGKNIPPGYDTPGSIVDVNNIVSDKTVIDKNTVYQTIKGFGASTFTGTPQTNSDDVLHDVLTLLYSERNGIGLDIYRYYLGAGSENDTALPESIRTQSFMTDEFTLDFTKDTLSQKCLEIAKEEAGDELQVVLFAKSPPVQLTKNGKAYPSPISENSHTNESNLAPENYEAFADYLYSVAQHFTEEGYRITGVSPVDEPQYSHRAIYNSDNAVSATKEGCHYSPEELRDLFLTFVKKFEGSTLHKSGVRINMFESGEAEGENSVSAEYLEVLLGPDGTTGKANKALRKYFDTVTFHSNWSSTAEKHATAELFRNKYPSYSIACTSYCQMTNDGNSGVLEYIVNEDGETKGLSIEYGLAMANIIMTDLTALNATQWNWHNAVSYENSPDGLIYLSLEEPSEPEISKRLWCLGNFSKFIEEGAVRLAFSTGNEEISGVCFMNPDGETVCIYLNMTESETTVDISEYNNEKTAVFVTDAERNLEKAALIRNGILSLPEMSLTTVIFPSQEVKS